MNKLLSNKKIFLIFLFLIFSWQCSESETSYPKQRFLSGAENIAFVDNNTCLQCHQKQALAWHGTHHQKALQAAHDSTVLGNFDNTTFTAFGVTTRFFRKNDQFRIHTEGPDGDFADYQVTHIIGIDPLQQYLVRFPNGRLQAFTVAWDVREKRWFHLQPEERITPDDPLHWSKRHFTWNSACAECHSTDLRMQFDHENQVYQTTWADITVSCQACHGPGAAHVKWAEKTPAQAVETQSESEMGLIVDYDKMNPKQVVDHCGRCHARRIQLVKNDQHQKPFLDQFQPELLREHLYHADGQILDEDFVFGSFIQSKMYHAGVSCLHCHNPHTLQLRIPGNGVCTQCHNAQPATVLYPNLKAINYDDPAHHFHEIDSEAAQCVTCHMPATTYMVIDPRRDHSFIIPRPDLSAKIGTPNPCMECHADQSNQWAARELAKRFGQPKPHFAETLVAARKRETGAADKLMKLAQDSTTAAIIRATALHELRRFEHHEKNAFVDLLADPEPLVRTIAISCVADQFGEEIGEVVQTIALLLFDDIHAVRIEAARVLAGVPKRFFSSKQRQQFQQEFAAWKEAQLVMNDHPEGHFNLGNLARQTGSAAQAERHYKQAITLDAQFLPAHENLAVLLDEQGQVREAEQVLLNALDQFPNEGALYYSLGLVQAAQNRTQEAVLTLGKAAQLTPNRPRVRYNLALALLKIGDRERAETQYLAALELAPEDRDMLYATAIFYAQQQDWQRAAHFANRLKQQAPQNRDFIKLFDYIYQHLE